jgi:hypothetical protein
MDVNDAHEASPLFVPEILNISGHRTANFYRFIRVKPQSGWVKPRAMAVSTVRPLDV